MGTEGIAINVFSIERQSMETDYFISFSRDATRVNTMSVYDETMRDHMTICQVFLAEKMIKLLCKSKATTISDTEGCDLTSVEEVLLLIKEYCDEYPESMAPFQFYRLMEDGGDTSYISELPDTTTVHDNDNDNDDGEYDSRDYKNILNEGARLREEDNYVTLKMMVTSMKDEIYHRLQTIENNMQTIEKNIQDMQSTIKNMPSVPQSADNTELTEELATKLCNYVDTRVATLNEDINSITTVLERVVLLDKILSDSH